MTTYQDTVGAVSGRARERASARSAQRAYTRRSRRTGTTPITEAQRIPFVAAIIGLLAFGLVMTLLLTTRSAEDSYQLAAARAANSTLANERAVLQRDVEAADSAPDLAAQARRLGMIPARDPARLVVAPDGSVNVVGKPTPVYGAPAPLLNPPLPTSPATGDIPGRLYPVAPPPTPGAVSPAPVPAPAPAAPSQSNIDVRAQGEQLVPVQISTPGGTGAGGAR